MSSLAARISSLAAACQQQYSTEYLAVVAAMNPKPSMGRKAADNAFLRAIVDSGWWAKLDGFFVSATDSQQNYQVNWKNPSGTTATTVGTVTLTPGFFTQGNGVDGLIDTRVVPNGSGNFKQNDLCFGAYFYEDLVNTTASLGTENSALLVPHGTTNSLRARAAQAGTDVPTVSGGAPAGMCMARRTTGAQYELWFNKTKLTTVVTASSSIAATTQGFAIGGWQQVGTDSFSTRKITLAFLGAAPTDTQWGIFVDAASTWLAAIGIVPQPQSVTTSRQTSTGFVVNVDMPAQAEGLTVTVECSTTTDFASIVATTTDVAVKHQGLDAAYCNAHPVFTGLTSNTRYYYRIKVGAVQEPVPYRSCKTFPGAGAGVSYPFVAFSCAKPLAGAMVPFGWAASFLPLFSVDLGDTPYDNYVNSSILGKRDVYKRQHYRNPSVQALNSVCGTTYAFDDHDAAKDNGNWNAPSYDFPTVIANSRTAAAEMLTDYAPLVANTVSGSWTIDKVHYIKMDTRSWRILTVGATPGSMLGDGVARANGYNPPNQLAAVIADAQAAAAGGAESIVLLSPTSWTATHTDGWRTDPSWIAEQVTICNALAVLGVRIFVISGDIHANAMGDQTVTNYASVASTSKWAQAVASPIFNSSTIPCPADVFFWNGVDSRVGDGTTNGQSVPIITVAANGRNFQVQWYIKPVTGGVMTTGPLYDTTDLWGA
jgi:hypothetical protein